jgi:FKBP-type peptidyl-prolyl cis-trans isomerase SlyD
MNIQPEHVVSLTYDLYVDNDGKESLVESATQEQPLTFLYGAGQMLPKFEENLSKLNMMKKLLQPYQKRCLTARICLK